MLYSGTLATIISGTSPASPYRFCTNATPKMACEPRNAPCVNAPTMLLSGRSLAAPNQMAKKYTVVTPAQNRKNFRSNCSVMRPAAISRNSSTGSSTLNESRSRSASVCGAKKCRARSTRPSRMIAKIGTVAFRQKIRLSVLFPSPCGYRPTAGVPLFFSLSGAPGVPIVPHRHAKCNRAGQACHSAANATRSSAPAAASNRQMTNGTRHTRSE